MINCVLDISQIEADRLDLHPCPMDPRTSALACLDLVRHAGETKGLELRFAVAPDVPRQILADPTRLRQVLLNLLGNAVKFTASGSVGLSLETAMDGARLLVSVTDTGPGVSAGFRGRLFQDFDRLGADAEGVVEGAGLGLALSSRLAALMGGSLVHGDNPGGGSVFWLDMPLTVAEEPPSQPAEPGAVRPSERSLRLLVVDDVDMNRNIAKAFLRGGGHQAVCVGSGAEAVAEAAGGGYDAILMDVRMPGMDGLEATRRIRALPGPFGLVPVIAVTAQVFAEQIDDCRRAGMDSHLGKPFSQAALLEAVALAAPVEGRGVSPASDAPADKVDGAPPPAAEIPGEPVFDREAFGRTVAFLAPDAVARHLQSLAAQGDDILHCLRGPPAMAASACGDLVDAAHTLGGSAGMFGFRRLLSCARTYEAAAEEDSPETMAALCALGAAIDASLPLMLGTIPDAA
jgi:CheY-like chemotaxis protein